MGCLIFFLVVTIFSFDIVYAQNETTDTAITGKASDDSVIADSAVFDTSAGDSVEEVEEFCVFWYEDSAFGEFIEPEDDSLILGCPDYRCTGFPHELWGVVKHSSMAPETLHCLDTICTIRGEDGVHNISWYFLHLIKECKEKKLRRHQAELDKLRKMMERKEP
ncbi:MAG: hypothetical protein GF401_12260 [Chitinivibrionales bacterium]|nr:hypothetical protein [Chitinivibrionales bacterium]